MRLYNYALVLVTLGACGGKAAKKPTAAAPAAPAATAQAVPAAVETKPVSTNVAVDNDLAAQCKLKFANVEHAPKFAYDEADLTATDRDVLQQVAECVLRGPLKGRTVSLVGRADPRGTSEYNLGLGTQRAESVRTYLQRLGVPAAQLTPTTRGDLDARGTDEASWQQDRRVDLKLGS